MNQDAGRKLYVSKCSKCHKLYDPARYSDPQWEKWMQKMTRKAKLNLDQKQVISNYVDAELRPKTPAGIATQKTRTPTAP